MPVLEPKIAINPADVNAPVGTYSHGIIAPVGRLLFISGQIPERIGGDVPEGFEAQYHMIRDNIGHILHDAGASLSALIKVTTYLTDRSQTDANGRIRRHYLGQQAAALTVVVVAMLNPLWLVEIDAVAAIS
jgi:enamine deaminase RidA (YjgF/YER057c/UK114 family)